MADLTTSLADYDVPELDLPAALAVLGGAALGALAGFLFLTGRGNRVRRDLMTAADDMFGGFDTFLATWNRVQHRGHLGTADRSRSGAPPPRPAGADT